MILISHRGNINGRVEELENNPDYILDAIALGYDVEIDIRYLENNWYLGHDKPQYKISGRFLFNPKLWLHCKNWQALNELSTWSDIKYFCHQEDDYALVSNEIIWVYPGRQLIEGSICVIPERGYTGDINKCYAICSDEIQKYKL
jgi:hypothetical protein